MRDIFQSMSQVRSRLSFDPGLGHSVLYRAHATFQGPDIDVIFQTNRHYKPIIISCVIKLPYPHLVFITLKNTYDSLLG